jgi:hypothetical protein
MRLSDGTQVGSTVLGLGDFVAGGSKLHFPRGVTWGMLQDRHVYLVMATVHMESCTHMYPHVPM